MDRGERRHLQFPPWAASAALVLLTLCSTVSALANQFVQDDIPIILQNRLVHTLRLWPLFTQGYWPPPYPRELYRPLTSSLFAFEWVLGGGRPALLRVVSLLLYIVATVAVYQLARRLLPAGAAWLAAAWFAVHPVHVEAVAVAVNQAELIVGAAMAWLCCLYIDRRRHNDALSGRWMVAMAAGYFISMLFKEHAVLLPLLMVAAECTVIADTRPWRDRLRALRPFYLGLALMAVSFVWVRSMALHGDTKGSFTAEALQGLTFGGRVRTMLGIVPEWARLFFWPDHLRADYSPQEVVAATAWAWPQILGALLLIVTAVIAWVCRHRRPVVTFGILWVAVGMVLISNTVIPLGIVLAERTLFLASIGVVIAAAGPIWDAGAWVYARGSLGRITAVLALLVLLAMGSSRSFSRQSVWHDVPTLWHQTLIDAPLSYRAHQAFGTVLFEAGLEREGIREYERAMKLFPKGWPLYLDMGDQLRRKGRCEAAIRYYRLVLALTPAQSGPRASEIACMLYIGEYRAAAFEARLGAGYGVDAEILASYAGIADSAERVHAPRHSVNLPSPIDGRKQFTP